MTTALQIQSDVDRQIAAIKTPPEANNLRKKIKAVQALAPKRRESYEVAFNGGRSFCEVSAKAGELWAEVENKAVGGNPRTRQNFDGLSVTDAGFANRQDAMMCVRLSELTPEERKEYYCKCEEVKKIPTLGGLYLRWKPKGENNGKHPSVHNIRVIRGDMLEIIPASDRYFDLIIADPPYNVTEWDWDDIGTPARFIAQSREWLEVTKSVLKPEYNLFWFCSPTFAADIEMVMRDLCLPIQSRIVWHRRNMAEGSDAQFRFIDTWEMIFHCGNRKLNFPSKWDDSRFDVQVFAVPQTNFGDAKLHPTQKPLGLIERLVNYGSYDGDSILDPFAGSGTTGAACVTHPRECVLIEKEQEYIEVINARLGL